MKEKESKRKKLSSNIIFFTITLCLFGLLMCLSTTSPNYFTKNYASPYSDFFEQLLFLAAGFLIIAIIAKLPIKFIRASALPLFLLSLFLLVLVLIPPFYVSGIVNETGEITKRWLRTPFGISIQPSEFAKLSLILFLANYFSLMEKKKIKLKSVFISVILIAIPALLVFEEPNFSASVLLVILGLVPMIVAGVSFSQLFVFIAPAALLIYFILFKSERLYARIKSLFNVFSDPLNSGYQIFQSFVAIVRGGVFGRGFMKSSQKFYLLPESHSDFVFSIICEEFGIIVAVIVMLLFLLLLFSILRVALSSKNYFDTILVSGIGAHIFIQAMMHICVGLGVMPPTGIPLPFISTGGSALLVNLIEIGLVLNVANRIGKGE
jgi:cell division protein FtsW